MCAVISSERLSRAELFTAEPAALAAPISIARATDVIIPVSYDFVGVGGGPGAGGAPLHVMLTETVFFVP
jgi:hypothetical protein